MNRDDDMSETKSGFVPQMTRAADHTAFRHDLECIINKRSRENGSNTPDFILAQYLANCLDAFDVAIGQRAQFYGRIDSVIGPIAVPTPKDGEA